MIYLYLLESTNVLPVRAGLLLQQQDSSIIVTSQSGIDAAILQTCRLAYWEAAEALYRHNSFMFNSASQIADFRSKGLRKVIVGHNSDQSQKLETVFYFQPTPFGRLLNIVKLVLMFTDRPDQEGSVRLQFSERDSVMEAWSELLFQYRQSNRNNQCSFPALETLRLDFQQLGLNNEEAIAVCEKLKLLDQLAGTGYG